MIRIDMWHLGNDSRTPVRKLDPQRAPCFFGALAHHRQAPAAAMLGARPGGLRESTAIVLDRQAQEPAMVRQDDARARCARMLERVCERLLRDPEEGELDVRCRTRA